MAAELICLFYFAFRTWHGHYFDVSEKFWMDPKNLVVTATISLTVLDMICYVIWAKVLTPDVAIRWSRPLRPLFIINFPDGRQIRKAFRNIRRTMNDIATILVLFLLTLLLFTVLAVKFFEKRHEITYPDKSDYFKNFFDSFWELYVLVTTANYPDVMMPAYDYSNWFALFFIIYLIICLYIFMTIVLAVIFYNYKRNLKDEVRSSVYTKRRKLGEAFDIVKEWKQDRQVVTAERWRTLMKLVDPSRSDTQIEILLSVLDSQGSSYIDRKNFLTVADLLQVKLTEVSDRMTRFEKCFPVVYNSYPSRKLRSLVRLKVFRYFFDFLIVLNAFIIAFSVDEAEWFFLSAFSIEILLKLYAFGPRLFFRQFWNTFDFLVIGSAVVGTVVYEILDYC